MLTVTEEVLAWAAAALALQGDGPHNVQDVPTYVTDEEGVVIYANEACGRFAGRAPVPGKDRWCVTWKLYTDTGEFLPHEHCPTAVAIREKRAIRDVTAVAERPDGTRVRFRPFPTPIFGRDKRLIGAVDVLMTI